MSDNQDLVAEHIQSTMDLQRERARKMRLENDLLELKVNQMRSGDMEVNLDSTIGGTCSYAIPAAMSTLGPRDHSPAVFTDARFKKACDLDAQIQTMASVLKSLSAAMESGHAETITQELVRSIRVASMVRRSIIAGELIREFGRELDVLLAAFAKV